MFFSDKKLQNQFFLACLLLVFGTLFFGASPVYSDEFTSTDYKVLDPVMNSGGYGTSANFQLFGSISEISIGTSTSVSFKDSAGFLYFPFASTPAVSTTAGDSQVALSWTASQGFLGWNISSYSVGQAIVSGGPYTYTSLGAVTSSDRTGLTNGTAYYFVIVAEDAFGNGVASSTEVSGTPIASPTPTPTPPGGGGGGGGTMPAETGVIFRGKAYPESRVVLLKDAQTAVEVVAGSNASFEISLTGLSAGTYNFGIWAEDYAGRKSKTQTYPVKITDGAITKINGVFLPPTIATDKLTVKWGDVLNIFGQSAPKAKVTILINSETTIIKKTRAEEDGLWLYKFDTTEVDYGNYSTMSQAKQEGDVSGFSELVFFEVSDVNEFRPDISLECPPKADLNNDCRVNLVDFSISAYWWKRLPLSDEFLMKEKTKLSGDGRLNLVDFSIKAYYWTG